MNPMSLARGTLEKPPSARGVGVNPWRQAGTHSRSTGVAHGEAVEKETVD